MNVSFDFDKTITKYPGVFAQLATTIVSTGGRAMVISGRKDDTSIRAYLHSNGFPEMEVVTKGDTFENSAEWKSRQLKENGIELHFDDDESIQSEVPVFTSSKGKSVFGGFR